MVLFFFPKAFTPGCNLEAQAFAEAIDEFKAAGVHPRDVWPQSFDVRDVLYWIQNEPRFGQQAVYLDDIDPSALGP